MIIPIIMFISVIVFICVFYIRTNKKAKELEHLINSLDKNPIQRLRKRKLNKIFNKLNKEKLENDAESR